MSTPNTTVSLPGRPVAEKIARELIETGVNFEGVTFGTYGDTTLHLFKQLCPDSVTITENRGVYTLKHHHSGEHDMGERGHAETFDSALAVAHYARGYVSESSKNHNWYTAPEALELGREKLSAEALQAAIKEAYHRAEGTGGSHRAYLAKTITEAISEKRYAAINADRATQLASQEG